MAGCVEVFDGYLQYVGEFTEGCAGFAVMTAAEYINTPTLETLFRIPESEATQQAFAAGFALPLILWLTAWGFGTVVHFINHRSDTPTFEE